MTQVVDVGTVVEIVGLIEIGEIIIMGIIITVIVGCVYIALHTILAQTLKGLSLKIN